MSAHLYSRILPRLKSPEYLSIPMLGLYPLWTLLLESSMVGDLFTCVIDDLRHSQRFLAWKEA